MFAAPQLRKINEHGLKHPEILARVAAEIQRCYRLGVTYDLAWELNHLGLSGYREVVQIRKDGQIIVQNDVYNPP
ncbi:MAG: hypothetical protein M2R45_02123 [Verrucomicrobia subdivision 3 bacterium]|nr:hypothetical protein [Limisphaerales bacterium]